MNHRMRWRLSRDTPSGSSAFVAVGALVDTTICVLTLDAMTSTYAEVVNELAALQSAAGGSSEQRNATAAVAAALFYAEFVDLARELKRRDVDAATCETAGMLTLKVGGGSVNVMRCFNQSELTITFSGFDPSVVPWDLALQRLKLGYYPVAVVRKMVEDSVRGIGLLFAQELAVRAGQRPSTP